VDQGQTDTPHPCVQEKGAGKINRGGFNTSRGERVREKKNVANGNKTDKRITSHIMEGTI
jgi:hypothetical protein